MIVFLIIIALFICIRTISYGVFEIKNCQNKFGGVFVIILSIASTIFAITMVLLR